MKKTATIILIAVLFCIVSGCSHTSEYEKEQEFERIVALFSYVSECIYQRHHDELELWNLFRNDLTTWVDAATAASLIHSEERRHQTPFFKIATSKRVDPILYNEIQASIAHTIALDSNENTEVALNFVSSSVQYMYELLTRSWDDYIEGSDIWEYEPPEWQDYFDWDSIPMTSGAQNDIFRAAFFFGHGGEELGVLYAMHLMRFGTHGWNIQCFIVLLAYIDDDVHDVAISAMVNRIIDLRDGDFEVYHIYLEMLTDVRRAFDVRTREIFNKIGQMGSVNHSV